jgi:hypothetical protein
MVYPKYLKVIGYAKYNIPFRLLWDHARVGFPIETGDVRAMADEIERLHRNPEIIDTASFRSRDFAAKHTFRKSFISRVDHIKSAVLPS